MNIDIAPETERVVREELTNGHFQSVDDLILSSILAWREKNRVPGEDRKIAMTLVDFFRESPLVGLELEYEREADLGRDIDL